MQESFDDMLSVIDSGAFVRVAPSARFLAFNQYLESAGYSIARLEVVKITGDSTGRRFRFDYLANRDMPDEWRIFLDPEKSAANARDIVRRALGEGGDYKFLVWAEIPPIE